MYFSLLFATDLKNGGFSNLSKLPWKISSDLKYFKEITCKEYKKNCKNILIMGNNTFLSKPKLDNNNRIELILSKKNIGKNYFNSLDSCLEFCKTNQENIGKIFVIGGKDLLETASYDPRCEEINMTLLEFDKEVKYDIFIDYKKMTKNFYNTYTDVSTSNCTLNNCTVSIMNKKYSRYLTTENNYLNLLRNVIDNGEKRQDRTGTGTLSLFGPQIEINIEDSFPLLTTKKLNFKNIVAEVLWFLSGSTNTKFLVENGVNIWNDNTSREFLDKRGLYDYKDGDIGPLYGYQWRNFGGNFKDPNSKGIDQINRMLNILKTDPTSRRIFMSAWNPSDLDKMVLEPCHLSLQLYVSDNKYLDGKLYMRSNDLFLGAPWNIAGYSLLIYMFGHLSGYKPRKLIYTIGDSHIYSNHIDQVCEQLSRSTRPFPKLRIVKKCDSFDDFDMNSFVLEDYNPHPFIKANMAV
jgi:thymidylate synthase